MKVAAPAWIAAAAGLALAAWTPARTAASQQQPVPSFRSTASLVALNVTVQDARSRYVTGLQPADFAVFEEGRRQDVRFFETAALPIDLILLIDTSRSMSPRLRMAQAAARGFLQTLRPRDRGAVIAFNETVRVLQPLTEDRSALEAAVDATAAGGTTALHTALYVALKQFGISVRPDGAVRRQAVVVLSDGEDTASLLTFDDVLALARQTGVNVYTVRVQANAGIARDPDIRIAQLAEQADFEMKSLARETGALSFFPTLQQLQGVYSSIANELASQYSIGYEPPGGDAGFRRVTVQVVSRPGLRARTRSGYTAGRHAPGTP